MTVDAMAGSDSNETDRGFGIYRRLSLPSESNWRRIWR